MNIQALIGAHTPGHALAQAFYTDPRVFELDLQRILLRHWFCVGHLSSLPRSGDYLVSELGSESIIVVRTPDHEIKVLVNVCRHRGSRLVGSTSGVRSVAEPSLAPMPGVGRLAGNLLTCPYHAWSYDLNGRLVAARQMPATFDRSQYGLKTLPVRVVEGLIFTTFAAEPLDFDPAAAALAQSAGVHGWGRAKVAYRETYAIKANWKLAVENYQECYHCQPAHPEYARRHVLARPASQVTALETAGRARSTALGIRIRDIDRYGRDAPAGSEYLTVFRSALELESPSTAVAPLMGGFPARDANSTYFDVGPLSDFLAYADHGLIYRFMPRTAEQTDMEVIWLVDEKAEAGRDYDVEALTALWRTTSLQDKKIVEWNQAGVNSRFFEPGPYSLQESYASRFIEWYLAELAQGG